jgi:hypothetical protein
MIPVVPMPAFPAPHWAVTAGPDLRASDTDRDVAADMLCAAVADGRLTLAELDDRLEAVLSARTLREIARLISDLPGRRFPEAVRAVRRPGALPPAPACPRPSAETRWSLLQSLLAPAGCQG